MAKAKRKVDSIMHEMDVEYSRHGISGTYRHLEIKLHQEAGNGKGETQKEN